VKPSLYGRPTTTLALPGDADTVLACEIAQAIRRDGRLNVEERRTAFRVAWCQEAGAKYPFWKCSYVKPCCYCEEFYE
jgi:hypothetical protein